MGKISEAQAILSAIGMPERQQTPICALSLLALAWETEVWIADEPDHMIHLNGNRFMGPR